MAADLTTSKRTQNVKTHIYLSVLLKGLAIVLSFWLVPLTLQYLGQELYGVWIVMLSIISWITLFDIGVGNGLRNKLAESLAKNNIVESRKSITTAFFIIGFIGLLLLLVLLISIQLIHWNQVFNTKVLTNEQFKVLMSIFFTTIILSFILNLINPILNACKLSSFTNIGSILTSLTFAILLAAFPESVRDNLINLTVFYSSSLLLSNMAINVVFFVKNKQLLPHPRYFNKSLLKSILTLGGSFFIIQIAVLFIFTVDNFIILQLLGAEAVSMYNISFKLFSVFTIGYGVVMAPLWSAFTEAYINKDSVWIRKTLSLLNLSLIPLCVGLLILMSFYQPILDIWLPSGESIKPSLNLIIALAVFVLISVWNNIYAFFLNGISETALQTKTAIFGALFNVPLAYFFILVLDMGLSGVVWAMCLSLSPFMVLGPIESFKFVNKIRSNNSGL